MTDDDGQQPIWPAIRDALIGVALGVIFVIIPLACAR